jgi:hypothetical protein
VFSLLFVHRITYIEPYEDLENIIPKFTTLNRFEDIQNVLYINLDERTDRREQAEQEFKRVGLRAQRIQAVKTKPGQLGCALSHIKCIEIAKEKGWDHVMVCEDDILFAKDAELVRQRINTFLSRHNDWDIIALGVNFIEGVYLDDSAAQIKSAYCTTCYIVRKEYYDILLNNFNVSAERLQNKTMNSELDVIWHSLQRRDRWMTILPYLVIQRDGVSDIAGKGEYLNYQNLLLENLKNIKGYSKYKENTLAVFKS